MPDKMNDPSATDPKVGTTTGTPSPAATGAGTTRDVTGTAAMGGSTSTSPGQSSTSSGQSAGDMARETTDAAKARAGELSDQARAEAASLADRGKAAAYEKVDETKERASAGIDAQADHIRAAGREFGEGSYPAQAADYFASSLHDAAEAIRHQDIGSVLEEVTAFARRNPAVFLGGAAMLGFVASRMLKASDRGRPVRSGASGSGYGSARGAYGGQDRFDAPPAGVSHTPYEPQRGTAGMSSPSTSSPTYPASSSPTPSASSESPSAPSTGTSSPDTTYKPGGRS